VVVHTLSTKSLEFVACASVKWRTVVNFLASPRHLGNPFYPITTTK
jgi:hypothetical protein